MATPGLTALRSRPPKTPSVPTIITTAPIQPISPFAGVSGGGIPVPNAFMPPNGFAGLAQQTAAVQSLFQRRTRGPTGARRRRKTPTRRGPQGAGGRFGRIKRQVARSRRATSKPQRMVKGSAAAKRHMAKLRRMRKR